MRPKVEIKGISEGLLVNLGVGSWGEQQQVLLEHIDRQEGFLRGARLVLDLGNQVVKPAELGQLRADLLERGISLYGVLSASPSTEKLAQSLGLATRISSPRAERSNLGINTTFQVGETAILVNRTLRSGYKVEHPGHVIILGDVNPGAEIIAGGNVVVWGHLRGMVHAGAEGNEQAVVCALDLSPIQLRIAGEIAITPQRRGKPGPEMAFIQDGRVVAESWDPKFR